MLRFKRDPIADPGSPPMHCRSFTIHTFSLSLQLLITFLHVRFLHSPYKHTKNSFGIRIIIIIIILDKRFLLTLLFSLFFITDSSISKQTCKTTTRNSQRNKHFQGGSDGNHAWHLLYNPITSSS